MAHPQNTMPRPMKTDVTIAGVEWNWMNVYRIMPVNYNLGLISRVTMTFSEFREFKFSLWMLT